VKAQKEASDLWKSQYQMLAHDWNTFLDSLNVEEDSMKVVSSSRISIISIPESFYS